jgi:hypothetical protein
VPKFLKYVFDDSIHRYLVDPEQFVSRCAGVTPSRRWQC